MLTNAPEINSVGGFGVPGGFGWGGGYGFGGGGLLEGIILASLIGRRDGFFGQDGGGHFRGGSDCCDDIKNNARNLAILEAIQNGTNQTVAEGRALGSAICAAEKTNLQQFYAAAIQVSNDTQAVKDQATAFAIVNDKRFDDLTLAGVTQTAAILARINQTEVDNLRDQLFLERTKCGALESKETINQLGISFGNQIQAANSNVVAVQNQVGQLTNAISILAAQVAKSSQDVINVGGLMAGVAQTANPVNVK